MKENVVLIETSSGVHAYFKDKPNTKISVPDEIWGLWKRQASCIPLYILRHLQSTGTDTMFHVRKDDLGVPGESFVIETITSSEGAFFLVTPVGQSDLAFPVQGYDAFCFDKGQFMLATQVKNHTQYVVDLPRKMLNDWVYPKTFPNSTIKIGDTVRFNGALRHPNFFSSQVPTACDNRICTPNKPIVQTLTIIVAGSRFLCV